MNILSKSTIRFSLLFVSGALIYMMTVLLWGITRGFDLMDEGFYLLLAKHPHQYQLMSYFAFWLACIPSFSANRVLDFRYSQIICQLGSSIILSIVYLRKLAKYGKLRNRTTLLTAGIFCLIGNLLLFAKFPFSISYNSLTGLFLFGATALIIDVAPFDKPFYSADSSNNKRQKFQLFCAGLLTGLCFSIKFPSCVIFIPSATVLICLLWGRNFFKAASMFIIGICISFIPMSIFIFNPIECWNTTRFFMSYQAQHQTLHSSLLATYAESILKGLKHFQPFLTVISILGFTTSFVMSRVKSKLQASIWRRIALASHLTLWLALAYALIHKDCLHHTLYTANVFFVIAIALFCQVAGYYFGHKQQNENSLNWRMIVLNLVVCMLPVICAAGTSNSLPYQSTIYLSSTFLLLIGLSVAIGEQITSRLPAALTMIVSSTFAVSQFYDGFVRHPYALSSRLNTQTQLVNCAELKGLRLAPSEAEFIEKVQKILRTNGFKEDDNLLGFYHLPGLVYAMHGNSPGLGWYVPFPANRDWNRHFLANQNLRQGKRLFLIVGWKLDSTIIAALHEAGVNFPTDFKIIGSSQNPIPLGSLDGVEDKEYLDGKTDIYEFLSE